MKLTTIFPRHLLLKLQELARASYLQFTAASLAFLLLVGNSYGNEFSGLVTRVSARRTINVWKEHLITQFASV